MYKYSNTIVQTLLYNIILKTLWNTIHPHIKTVSNLFYIIEIINLFMSTSKLLYTKLLFSTVVCFPSLFRRRWKITHLMNIGFYLSRVFSVLFIIFKNCVLFYFGRLVFYNFNPI